MDQGEVISRTKTCYPGRKVTSAWLLVWQSCDKTSELRPPRRHGGWQRAKFQARRNKQPGVAHGLNAVIPIFPEPLIDMFAFWLHHCGARDRDLVGLVYRHQPQVAAVVAGMLGSTWLNM